LDNNTFMLIFCLFLVLFVVLAWIMLRNAKLYFSRFKYFSAFVCGIVGITCLALPILIILPLIAAPNRPYHKPHCTYNLYQIGKGLAMYSMDHNDQYPQDLQTLAIEMKLEPKLFVCPSSKHVAGSLSNLNEWTDYVYIQGLSATNNAHIPLAYELPINHNGEGVNVLYNDGTVRWLNLRDYLRDFQGQITNTNARKP